MPRKKGEHLTAIANIKNNSMSYRVASKTYGVPIATFCDRTSHFALMNLSIGKNNGIC